MKNQDDDDWEIRAIVKCNFFITTSSNNKFGEDVMGGPCSTNGEKRTAYRLLVGKPEGKRPLGKPRRRWVVDTGGELL
jgi:hypothetical protein